MRILFRIGKNRRLKKSSHHQLSSLGQPNTQMIEPHDQDSTPRQGESSLSSTYSPCSSPSSSINIRKESTTLESAPRRVKNLIKIY